MEQIKCPVRKTGKKNPKSVAIISGSVKITYGKLDLKISAMVNNLKSKGINSGTNVVIVSENSPECIILIFSILRLGATVIPLNFRFPEGKVKKVIKDTGAVFVISSDNRDYGVTCLNIKDLFCLKEAKDSGTEEEEFISGKTVTLTSGTTGKTKGVVLSVGNHYYSALGSNENILLTGDDKWLLVLPLFHVGGLGVLFRVFLSGASVVLPESRDKGIGNLIVGNSVSHVSFVSSQLLEFINYLEKRKINSPGTLKVALTGGSAVSESLLTRALDLDIPVYKTYGMTEMSSQVTTTCEVVSLSNIRTSGSVLRYREISIGENGSVLVRGKTLFSGYLTEKGFVPAALNKEGWFDTGDIGEMDKSGNLFIKGRKDNMFVSGGENIFPEEIEKELLKTGNIDEAVVVAIGDEKYGKRPVAFINTGGKKVRKSEIVEVLKNSLPAFKVPDKFYYLDDMKSGQIKRKRYLLKEMAKSGEGLKIISD